MLIREYTTKKISAFLNEKPKQVCLVFIHGLGDVIMFLRPLQMLRAKYPDTTILFGVQAGVGQFEFFESMIENVVEIRDANQDYPECDYTFQVHFPMAESFNGTITKAELCCDWELGIDRCAEYPNWAWSGEESPFIGVCFQATAMPHQCNPEPAIANKIWDEIKAAGFIPIETQFSHVYSNPRNAMFNFVTRHVRDLPATISDLVRLQANCFANISVSTGNFHSAVALNPLRTLYLKKEYDVSCYTRLTIPQIDVTNYQDGCVANWLTQLKKDRP